MSRNFILILAVCACAVSLMAQKRPASASAKKPAPAQSSAEEKAQYPIVELITTGSERYDAEDILKTTGLKVDETVEIPLDNVKAAAEKLINSGAFAEVTYKHVAAPGGARVEFTLGDKDDDQFIKCDFTNIVWLTNDDLLIELHDRVPLFNGTVPRDGTLADDMAQALHALLEENGVDADIVHEHQDALPGKPGTEMVAFRVANVDIKIAKVEISGSSPAMQGEMSTVSKKLQGTTYDRISIKNFVDHSLLLTYLKHGYLKASFSAPVVSVLTNSGKTTEVAVQVPVSEGRVYRAGTLRWSGNKAMLAESLTPYLRLAPGAIVDGAKLRKDIDGLRFEYAALGYLHMLLTAIPTYDDAAGIVNYEMFVKEGELFEMGKFDLEGVPTSEADKIRHVWQLREGAPFDPKYLNSFLQKLTLGKDVAFLVDESQGERPNSIDVTLIFCGPQDPCKSKTANQLYVPPAADDGNP